MQAQYIKADPSGNTTVFIIDPVSRSLYEPITQQIMTQASVGAEQVGFIHPSSSSQGGARMEMMGGEFCGNASRSFAAWLAFHGKDGLSFSSSPGQHKELKVEVSGSLPLKAGVTASDRPNVFYAEIEMPLPGHLKHGTDPYFGSLSVVPFEGITHIVLWEHEPMEKDEEQAKALLEREGGLPPAFGLMYYDRKREFLRPYVMVRAVGSKVWESSCGSGSCAVASAKIELEGRPEGVYDIKQPGGVLTIKLRRDTAIREITLGGEVRFTAAGTLFLDV